MLIIQAKLRVVHIDTIELYYMYISMMVHIDTIELYYPWWYT